MIDAGVDIWVAHLDEVAGEMERFCALLDGAEMERVARLPSDLARRRFTAKHAIRRLLLAGYLEQPPEQIAFSSAQGQKPRLESLNRDGVHFNESSSDELAVFAVAHGVELGIDVERLRPIADAAGIVARFGSAAERAALSADLADDETFLRWWTAKEAFVKAIGTGLDHPLDAFSITVTSRKDAPTLPYGASWGGEHELRLLEVDGSRDAASRYSLTGLTPAAGFVGALVVTGRPSRIRQHRWSPDARTDTRGAA